MVRSWVAGGDAGAPKRGVGGVVRLPPNFKTLKCFTGYVHKTCKNSGSETLENSAGKTKLALSLIRCFESIILIGEIVNAVLEAGLTPSILLLI